VRFIPAPPPSALSERSKGRGRIKIPSAKIEDAAPAKKLKAPARAAPKPKLLPKNIQKKPLPKPVAKPPPPVAKLPPKPVAKRAPPPPAPVERSSKAKLKECISQLQQILNSM
jgi:hypothetical protein